MSKAAVAGMIIGIGLLILLKVFQDSIPRITDPLTNILILIGFVLFAIIYGVSQLRKKNEIPPILDKEVIEKLRKKNR
ncbi:hypothetical protein MHZ95_12575 [Sporosarcina sp. ACRSM]|uniref:hypothetical protein n=1 Tax=Sporosarcina sp. ACRSM TaxID=2918216 RepID=UPI001EF49BAA|nr:hypothetical protein [Sporosarcina sp. ACRSM]MCG7336099.1 hypothetical protein [Sporosarcina sp. ACRSM]